ncbi:MAG TPA: helix-turn-helix domain-containing protein [Solirubrobacteraceae bacterium]|nr:helix-turn-helix domain-containing protein [Solirubrobacteraceae bacterium]
MIAGAGKPDDRTKAISIVQARRDEMVRSATATIIEELPPYATSENAALADEIGQQVSAHIDAFIVTLHDGGPPDTASLTFIETTVERRTSQGIPPEAVLQAYRVAHHVIWRRILATENQDGEERLATLLAEPMMQYIEAAWAAVAKGYIQVERRLEADLDRVQSRVVEAMLDGRAQSETPQLGAGAFPIGADELYLVVVVHGFSDNDAASLRSAARRLGDARGLRGSVARVRNEDLIAIVALGQKDPRAATDHVLAGLDSAVGVLSRRPAIGVGMPTRGPAGVPAGSRQAEAAAAKAGPGHACAMLDLRLIERMSLMLPRSDSGLHLIGPTIQEFVREDLDKHGTLVDTFLAYAACDLNARRTAEALHVHSNTVLYRLRRIDELTGLNVQSAHDVIDLVAAIRLLENPERLPHAT